MLISCGFNFSPAELHWLGMWHFIYWPLASPVCMSWNNYAVCCAIPCDCPLHPASSHLRYVFISFSIDTGLIAGCFFSAVVLIWALIQFQPSAYRLWPRCVHYLSFSCVLDSSVYVLVSTSTGYSPGTGKAPAKSTGGCTSNRYSARFTMGEGSVVM